MKRIIYSLIACFITLVTFAQDEKQISEFKSNYFNETFSVKIIGQNNKDFKLIIAAKSLDDLHDEGGVFISSELYQKFVLSIDSAKAKYVEYVNIAKTNNVKELDKRLNYTFKADGFFEYGSSWEFQFDVLFKYDFKISAKGDDVKYLLIVRSGELTSSSNPYIKMDGFVWVFNSIEEIDSFKEAISKQNIDEFFSKPKVEDLFKN
jgi:hypothetical protein